MHAVAIIRRRLLEPWFHIGVLTVATFATFSVMSPMPMDDHFLYQKFIETLAMGKIDTSILGFHGASFLALPLYLITGSSIANIEFQMMCAIIAIPLSYMVARSLFDEYSALLFAYATTLSPFLLYVAYRGFTGPSYLVMVFLTLYGIKKNAKWSWLPLSVAMLIKPFAIALVPFLFLGRDKLDVKKVSFTLCLVFSVPAAYVLLQVLQIGTITVGAHANLTHENVFHLSRIPLNIAHGIQMLFSVHNFYFPDPAKTMQGNLVHSSPILMLLGTLALLHPKGFWSDRTQTSAFRIAAIIAYVMPALLSHMDHFYMETCVLLLALAGLSVLKKYPLMIALTLATFHFQWLYFYLAYADHFRLSYSFFLVPVLADVMLVLFVAFHFSIVKKALADVLFLPNHQNKRSS